VKPKNREITLLFANNRRPACQIEQLFFQKHKAKMTFFEKILALEK